MQMPRISERAGRVLSALVREYIETGQPVGSHTLARRLGMGLSPATVRNVLAQLDEQGFIHQPHTSAGRIPTDLGYRFYVDTLLHARRTTRTSASLEAEIRQTAGGALMDDVLAQVSHLLSRNLRQVGFALAPENEAAAFHRIDFVPLANTAVLVVMVARGGQVTHKVVDIREQLDADVLQQAANYLNSEFAGWTLAEVRAEVMERLRQERALYDILLSRALRLAQSTFEGLPTANPLFIEGASLLLDNLTESGPPIATLQVLLKLVEEKDRLVRLLTEYLNADGLTVIIGTEHRAPDLKDFALVTSTYFDGRRVGRVGIIGPTRMPYWRSIALVDSVARAVSHVLRDSGWDQAESVFES